MSRRKTKRNPIHSLTQQRKPIIRMSDNKDNHQQQQKPHHQQHNDNNNNDIVLPLVVTTEEWFGTGRRVPFDPNHKKIAAHATANTIQVFERVVVANDGNNNDIDKDSTSSSSSTTTSLWCTMLPSFPDGSYGFGKMERLWQEQQQQQQQQHDNHWNHSIPPKRLYVEYVGQGDSEKPIEYSYSTEERADLVQALWAAHKIPSTVVVAAGYSSLVVLELLRRQQEREREQQQPQQQQYYHHGAPGTTRIDHVLVVNGNVYADGPRKLSMASHLLLLQSRLLGRHWGATLAQRSNLVLDLFLRPYWYTTTSSRRRLFQPLQQQHHHHHQQQQQSAQQQQQHQRRDAAIMELRETEKVIRRHGGTAAFLAQAADTLSGEEHQVWADKWDLSAIYLEYAAAAGITFDVVSCCADSTTTAQVDLVEERLGGYPGIFTGVLPGNGGGGHLLVQAPASLVCSRIQALMARATTAPTASDHHGRDVTDPTNHAAISEPWFLPQIHYGMSSSM